MMRILSGQFKGQKLLSPKGARPTLGVTRQSIFNICKNQISDASFLDLFAASGAMGLEALSNGSSFSTFVEKEPKNCHIIQQNIEKLNLGAKTCILKQDVFKALEYFSRQSQSFDLIYADPPYSNKDQSFSKKLLQKLDADCILNKNGLFFLEDTADFELDYIPKNLRLIDKRKIRYSQILIYTK